MRPIIVAAAADDDDECGLFERPLQAECVRREPLRDSRGALIVFDSGFHYTPQASKNKTTWPSPRPRLARRDELEAINGAAQDSAPGAAAAAVIAVLVV